MIQSGGSPLGPSNASGPRINELDGYETFTYAGKPKGDPTVPELTVTTDGLDLTLSWSAAAGAAGYRLWYALPTDDGTFNFTVYKNGQGIYLGQQVPLSTKSTFKNIENRSEENWPCNDRDGYKQHLIKTDPVIQQKKEIIRKDAMALLAFYNALKVGPNPYDNDLEYDLIVYYLKRTTEISLKALDNYVANELKKFDNRCKGCPDSHPVACDDSGACCSSIHPNCCQATNWCCPTDMTCCPNAPGCYPPGGTCCDDGSYCPSGTYCGNDGYCYDSKKGVINTEYRTPARTSGGGNAAH